MTIDEAKQKILQRVLETKTGWRVTLQQQVSTDMVLMIVRNDSLPSVKAVREKDGTSDRIFIQTGEESMVDSTEFPELLGWFENTMKQSHEQRVIQFAESL